MRILTITNWYPPHHRGGYEVNCADLMTSLVRRGHQVEVLCSNELFPGVELGDGDIPVRRQLQMYWRDERPWTPPLREQLAIERANQAALVRALDSFQPDLVSAWQMAAFSLSVLTTVHRRRLPIFYTLADAWPSYTLQMDPWAGRFRGPLRVAGLALERLLGVPVVLPEIDKMGKGLFCSAFLRDGVRGSSPWRFRDAEVIPLGIDRENLSGSDPQHEWGWKLIYLGRFDPRKGTDALLRALPLLPAASLTMYGRGGDDERIRLEQLAAELGVADRISFGSLDRSDLGDAYRAADCVIFPSEWPEPFGLVPIEAMECGVPVVATGVGGSSEFLVDGVNCVIFEPGQPDRLAAAVERLANDADLRHRLQVGGHQTAKEYDIERMADAYEMQFRAAKARA